MLPASPNISKKEIIVNDENIGSVNLVLKLAIENDDEYNKNSIITWDENAADVIKSNNVDINITEVI